MKIGINDLRKIIKESVNDILKEDKKTAEDLDDSIDRQVDKYLTEYESQSKPMKKESRNLHDLSRDFFYSLLAEADEEKKDETNKLTEEDIDVGLFADNVVRLIDNYDSLLEVKETIAKRAIKFLEKNYEPSVADKFKIVLEDEYDLYVGKSAPDSLSKYPAPPADRSNGPVGGGA
jgi:hypothetical protein